MGIVSFLVEAVFIKCKDVPYLLIGLRLIITRSLIALGKNRRVIVIFVKGNDAKRPILPVGRTVPWPKKSRSLSDP